MVRKRERKAPPYLAMSIGFIAVSAAAFVWVAFMKDGGGMKFVVLGMLLLVIAVMSYNLRVIARDRKNMREGKDDGKK